MLPCTEGFWEEGSNSWRYKGRHMRHVLCFKTKKNIIYSQENQKRYTWKEGYRRILTATYKLSVHKKLHLRITPPAFLRRLLRSHVWRSSLEEHARVVQVFAMILNEFTTKIVDYCWKKNVVWKRPAMAAFAGHVVWHVHCRRDKVRSVFPEIERNSEFKQRHSSGKLAI